MSESKWKWSPSLPRQIAAKLAAELAEGESVVWVGHPRRELPSSISWTRMFIVVSVALVSTVVALATDDLLSIIFAIIAGLSWLVVMGGLALPLVWRLGVVQENFYYLVTTHRVLICNRVPTRFRVELRSYLPVNLDIMVCVERDNGSGDIRFDGGSDENVSLADGFINIDKVREVERLIRETLHLK